MRRSLLPLLAAGLLLGPAAQAATHGHARPHGRGHGAAEASAPGNDCARLSERPAFDVTELKSQLMVTAIACKAQDRYNAFINRYRGDIVADDATLNGYFRRVYNRQAQKQHDEYITSLANVQSQQSEKLGTGFCGERLPMFDEVAALESPGDLADYARGKNLAVPAALNICASEPAERPATTRHVVRKVHHKH